jgi:hypothetical protein
MGLLVECFRVIWDCVPGNPGGPNPAPEINAANSVVAIALLLSIAAIAYRRLQQEQH